MHITVIPGRAGMYFTWAELTRTSKPIDNVPSQAAQVNLMSLVRHVLDPLRAHLGKPVEVTSGYRNTEVNAAVGGSETSAHLVGLAADIKVKGMTSFQLAEMILSLGLVFDQLIHYDSERGGQLHVGIARAGRVPRKQVLRAPAGSKGYTTSSLA
jgi:hypothetical protein